MTQSTLLRRKPGLHVGIIMDGNGRWATQRGLARSAGHRAGIDALRRAVAAAPAHGISILSVFAFSSANWKRPSAEIEHLLSLLAAYLRTEAPELYRNGVRMSVIGRRDRLPQPICDAIRAAELLTRPCEKLHLRVAIDYSARDAILAAVRHLASPARTAAAAMTPAEFRRVLASVIHSGEAVPDVDLMIRTAGEQRLSDFLLWEAAYAELHFTSTLWPEFSAKDLQLAMADFRSRDRRFGAAPAVQPNAPALATQS
jgi:undecaprenyl diphosphate synthase